MEIRGLLRSDSYFSFVIVFRLITPYASTMKIASTANPTGYSGMGAAVTVRGSLRLGGEAEPP